MTHSASNFLIGILFLSFFISSCDKIDNLLNEETEITHINETINISLGETKTLLLLTAPCEVLMHYQNKGNTDLLLHTTTQADPNGETRTVTYTLPAGSSHTEDIDMFLEASVSTATTTSPLQGVLVFEAFYIPNINDHNPADWLSAGTICANGDVQKAPDSDIDCLWDKQTIWQTASPKKIDIELFITGNHDLKVEIEYSNHTFSVYNVSAPPALPQFQSLVGEWEDIIAIHVICQKSPVNNCSDCQFDYSICY